MSTPLSAQLEGLFAVLNDLHISVPSATRTPRKDGLVPLVPYEKLHEPLEQYTHVLGSILRDFDKRLKALEQKAQLPR